MSPEGEGFTPSHCETVKEVVFDLGCIEVIQSPWTVTLALLINLARKTGVRCRVMRLRAQPGAIVAIYHLDQTLKSLFDNGEVPQPTQQGTGHVAGMELLRSIEEPYAA